MVVMILEKTPASLKGDLSRWLIEVKSGVYVGHVSAMVRDRLWERCSSSRGVGMVFQAWSTNNEQHFMMKMAGNSERRIVDWEGVQLVEKLGDALSEAQKRRILREI
ncbi:MAG: type I-E CRISPR-associated endoribonuclease Cas2 [Anaerolineae bacterium]|nr:type I-E CRISPR-associated endoribonuclease Cas2 [Anaerolineae bacterium]